MKNWYLMLILTVLVSGCASGWPVRSTDSMFKENKINSISILTSGRVEWPPFGNSKNEAKFGLHESKESTRRILDQVKSILSNKGYDIKVSEIVGVGFSNPYMGNFTIYNNYLDEGDETKKWRLDRDKDKAAYIEKMNLGKDSSEAAVELMLEYERLMPNNAAFKNRRYRRHSQKNLYRYKPEEELVNKIAKSTKSDTVCLMNVYGRKFTSGRKVGAAISQILVGGRGLKDSTRIYMVCSNSAEKDVVWQNQIIVEEDPLTIEAKYTAVLLKLFPERGKPMTADCVKSKQARVYDCPRPSL